eukprot:4035803-Alexandrium_andersonii.AAC.1
MTPPVDCGETAELHAACFLKSIYTSCLHSGRVSACLRSRSHTRAPALRQYAHLLECACVGTCDQGS